MGDTTGPKVGPKPEIRNKAKPTFVGGEAKPTFVGLGPKAASQDEVAKRIADAIGGDQVAIEIPDGTSILVDAAALAGHIDLARAPWVPMLPELLAQPAEIWAMFMRHKGTGRVVLRKRLVKVVQAKPGLAGKADGLMLVADAGGGFFHGWSFLPMDRPGYINRQRVGRLLWRRS